MRDEFVDPRILDSTVKFRGAVWDVVEERFVLPGTTTEISRQIMVHPGAVGIVALDDQNRIMLMQQYRHPMRIIEWEVPAGILDVPGEAPHEAAARELREEVDLSAKTWNVLADQLSSPGGSAEALRIYLARDITSHPPSERFDEESQIRPHWIPLEEAMDAVLAGDVTNATACIGILHTAHHVATGFKNLRPVDAPWPAREHLLNGLLGES